MSEENSASVAPGKISWKQGMFVALGVPLLILPSLADVSTTVWGLAIVVWSLSVLQGFVQNLAYGEMVTTFPNATGLPGCAQTVFQPEVPKAGFDGKKFIGAFSAWCYWFAWCPVVMIFTMLIATYLDTMFEWGLTGYSMLGLDLACGVAIVCLMCALGFKGMDGGALMSTILAILSIVPISVILIAAYVNGMFHFDTITGNFLPPGWGSAQDIVMLLGLFGLAQWSACAWETAAIYGPQYENPGKDVPKALFGCGFVCLILFFFISFSVYGDGEGMNYTAFIAISQNVFGDAGRYIAGVLLIIAMVLIVQTGFLGSSNTLYSMAGEGNLPKWFGELNKNGQPAHAMIFVSIFNLALITLIGYSGSVLGSSDTNMTVLSASAMGYTIANGIALLAYVMSHRDARFKDLPRPFAAPKLWHSMIIIFVVLQFCIYLPCLAFWSYKNSGDSVTPLIIGAVVLMVFIPVWYYVQKHKSAEAA